ncbi:hypothetical protein ACFLTI_05525 [Bacteroidota bacterium]
MSKKFNYLILFSLLFFIFSQSFGQNKCSVKFMNGPREDGSIAYNFFVGDDAEAFATSINGFGSGFVFDIFTGRESYDIITIGTKNANLSLGAGVAISKYRFQDNLILSLSNDGTMVNWEVDTDGTHDYGNSFFSYGKSKLITASVFFPAYLNFRIGRQFDISAGGFVDLYFYGRHKRKFKVGDDKNTEIVGTKDFKDFNLNKTKYGVSATIMHRPSGIGISGTYFLTPFFQEGMGPDLTEVRIALIVNVAKNYAKKFGR